MSAKPIILGFLVLITSFSLSAQEQEREYVHGTFKSTRVINSHSIETLPAKTLDFRVSHRFGDFYDENEQIIHNFLGFDQAADILIGLEYGVTNDFMIGYSRTKGNGPQRELWNVFAKYRVLKQTTDNKIPLSITLFANTALSGMKRSTDNTSAAWMPKFSHRFSYTYQAVIGRKFTDWFSLYVSPTYLHRNYVTFGDENGNFSLGTGARVSVSKHIAIIVDYYYVFSKYRHNDDYRGDLTNPLTFHNPLGVGIEFETKGHIFQLNFTNAPALLENDYLAYSNKDWLDGEFRFGFTISREFRVGKK